MVNKPFNTYLIANTTHNRATCSIDDTVANMIKRVFPKHIPEATVCRLQVANCTTSNAMKRGSVR